MAGIVLERMETLLIEAARNRSTLTYQQVAQRLELQPPHTIHQAAEWIEALMRIHAHAGAPQLASLVISKSRGGLPALGFFLLIKELGLYDGSVDGEDARQFHAREMQRCFDSI
jgi:hypothetical protein